MRKKSVLSNESKQALQSLKMEIASQLGGNYLLKKNQETFLMNEDLAKKMIAKVKQKL